MPTMSGSMLPFLYMTRTILRGPPARSAASLRTLHTTARCLKSGGDIPFVHEVADDDTPKDPTAMRGTITPSERLVFERIFADIRARGLKPSIRDEAGHPEASATAQRSAMLIMQQAASDAGQSRPATITSPGLLAGAARDRSKALLRFPPELRAAASRALSAFDPPARGESMSPEASDALNLDEVDQGWKAPAHSFMRTVEVEAKRLPERRRVERLITGAKSDLELWDVLEKEVFTFPARFGLGSMGNGAASSGTPDKSAKGRKPKAQKKAEAKSATETAAATAAEADPTTQAAAATLDSEGKKTHKAVDAIDLEVTENTLPEEPPVPSERMNLYIYGPLYPAYLLLALRRLDSAFKHPSPLVFNLLPRIKELGLESFVLGISTPLYNELLDIYWRRRGDLNGLLNLLEEMRHCGLYLDEQTSSILANIGREAHELSLARFHGSSTSDFSRVGFAAAVMTMPEYEMSVRDRIRHWQRAVDISIDEKKADFSKGPLRHAYA